MSKMKVRKTVKAVKVAGSMKTGKVIKAGKAIQAPSARNVSSKALPSHSIKSPPKKPSRLGKPADKLTPPESITPEPEIIIRTVKRSAAELKQLRDRLQKLHDIAVDSIGFLAGGRSGRYGEGLVGKVNGDGQNTDEDGTASFSQDLSLMQMSNKKDMLNKIVEAFRRLDQQTYGVCEACGELITKARLEVQPFAPLCIKCQSAAEANRPRSQGFGKSMMQIAQPVDSERSGE